MKRTDYQQLLTGIQALGFGDLIVGSHEEAKANQRLQNIVLMENPETGGCDIYLTYKHRNIFGEFVCWVEEEFETEENLVDIVLNAVDEFYHYTPEELDQTLIPNNQLIPGFTPLN